MTSIDLKKDYSLKSYNSFGVEARAEYFAEAHSREELQELLTELPVLHLPRLVLGGGSNILFTHDFPGLVILNCIGGVQILKEDDEHAWVESGAGIIWHDLVAWTVDHRLGGLENLSLIPGTVGAAPIQNIGAYGVELKETFVELEALDLEKGMYRTFHKEECRFGYRDSIFKQEARNRFAITRVTFRLNKKHQLNTSYGAIRQELEAAGIAEPTVRDVSEAVIRIRKSKLPDPAKLGNAGSFFKNPEVTRSVYETLKESYPELVAYPAGDKMKLAAGWLIEYCGWKGNRSGNVGMHKDQALVLVNYGEASGRELLEHARNVQQSVMDQFNVHLDMEVNIL